MNFLDFASTCGLDICRLDQGRIIRCATKEHPRKKNGAYLYDGDWGWVMDWSQHPEPIYWTDETITKPHELAALRIRMEASRKKQAQERAQEAQKAAQRAVAIIKSAKMEMHAYLDAKGFPDALGMVYYPAENENLLVIPMRIGSDIVGCQLIDRDGNKKFLKGQRTNGASFTFGSTGTEIFCEGYATALSIKTALDALKFPCRVHACFSAGNLQRMANRGFVVADCDNSGTGEKAAQATGLPYWMPEEVGQDFNDVWQRIGTFAAGMELRKWLQKVRQEPQALRA